MLDVVQIPLGPYRTNCYLVAREGASEAVVIDPGDDSGTVLSVLADRGWTPTAVLVTHGHSDHLGAVRDVAEASGIEGRMANQVEVAERGLGIGDRELPGQMATHLRAVGSGEEPARG